MGYTINLEDDFVGAEELQLLKTKREIMEKLRVRFAEMAKAPHLAAAKTSTAKAFANRHTERPR
jgi:hypothetical protein